MVAKGAHVPKGKVKHKNVPVSQGILHQTQNNNTDGSGAKMAHIIAARLVQETPAEHWARPVWKGRACGSCRTTKKPSPSKP